MFRHGVAIVVIEVGGEGRYLEVRIPWTYPRTSNSEET